jgi:hypothetical protein
MTRTRWQTLLATAGVSAAVSWTVLRLFERHSASMPPTSWLVCLVLLATSGLVFSLGWAVRQGTNGKGPKVEPVRAVRTVVLAKASCYTGSLLLGWYVAQVLLVIGDLANEPRRERAVTAGVAAICALVLAVVGLVVERFCQVPPPSVAAAEKIPGSAAPSSAH